jgi:TonB family protein
MTTMIAEPPPNTTLGVGFENRRRAGNPEAWKKAIGTRPIAARLALLPEEKPRWDRMGVSAAAQFGLLFFLLLMPLLYPNSMKTALNYSIIELAQPVTMVPTQPPPPPPPKMKAKTPPPVVPEPVKLNPKQPHIFITPKAAIPQPRTLEAKAPELNPQFDVVKMETTQAGPKRPREEVKLNNMASMGSAAPATVKAPIEKVQTGGFGDEHGLPANKSNPNRAVNMNVLGSPALPGGPGYGNGTGGAKGARGTVVSGGFGNGTAIVPESSARKGTLQSSGFSNQSVATDAPKKRAESAESATTPVDILDKPRPEYTAEGRSLKIEGDVVLDVVFLANGSVQMVRVVSGLGHGLDEAAERAAQQIKFKPAKREGQPVDYPARVRITFQLAY